MPKLSLFARHKAKLRLVGSLGFEPRIANAPGWYTKPMYPTQNQSTQQSEQTKTESVYDPKETQTKSESQAIRRPQPNPKYKTQIDKTIEKAKLEGKQQNTIHNFYCKLRQLSNVADLDNPEDVKKAISYAKLSNSSKTSFVLAYEWYTKTNGLKWEKPRFKWHLGIPIIPTTSQVYKIISASTQRFATIYNIMAETGVEGEELRQTHRNQFDPSQNILNIKGLKGHGDNNYKLKPPIAEMLRQYLARNPQDYPFPRPKTMSHMWITARTKASKLHNDPQLLKIPMKSLSNYSGAQLYY